MRNLVLSVLFMLMGSHLALANEVPLPSVEVVPTLGEWGIIALAIIPGILGALVLKKRLFSKP